MAKLFGNEIVNSSWAQEVMQPYKDRWLGDRWCRLTTEQTESLKRFRDNVIALANEAIEKINAGHAHALVELYGQLKPIWLDSVYHRMPEDTMLPTHTFSHDFYTIAPYDSFRYGEFLINAELNDYAVKLTREDNRQAKELLMSFDARFLKSVETSMSEENFLKEVARSDVWVSWARTPHNLNSDYVWENEIDYEPLEKLEKLGYPEKSIDAVHYLLKGYTVEQIAVYNGRLFDFSEVTSEELLEAEEFLPAKQVEKMFELEARVGEEFTGRQLVDLLEVGFKTPKEVRAYASRFAVKRNDFDYFGKLVEAKGKYDVLPMLEF